MEKQIAALIEPLLNSLGFDLVKIAISGLRYKTLSIMLEKKDGSNISVSDCQLASRNISPLLDVEDVIKGKYFLEVSSAGIERPLVREQDFQKVRDREIKIRLKIPVDDKSSLRGILIGYENNQIHMQCDGKNVYVDHDNVKNAKLAFTEDNFRALLNKNKKDRQEQEQGNIQRRGNRQFKGKTQEARRGGYGKRTQS
jgi:ribosome maturation factor RimP